MFKLYVQFLHDAGLLGKTTIGIDGSKFKAVNSKKNNHNQSKIDKHLQYIEDKTNAYLQELDAIDDQENSNADELNVKKDKISGDLSKLTERRIKYDSLQQQLDATTDKQISTIDFESRSIMVTKAIADVTYNVQNAVDPKHNLIVHPEANNNNCLYRLVGNGKALHKVATIAKANLQLKQEHSLLVQADKGYHTGANIRHLVNKKAKLMKQVAAIKLIVLMFVKHVRLKSNAPKCRIDVAGKFITPRSKLY